MFIIGIDLSGPSNSGATVLTAFRETDKGRLKACGSLQGADDADIVDFIKLLGSDGRIIAGLDAPLSYNLEGGDRTGDAELRRRLIDVGLPSGSVMTPTMTRMVYLTLRGMAVARLLKSFHENIQIVEVHPGGAMALRGAPIKDVAGFKQSLRARRNLLNWLEQRGLLLAADISDPGDHYVAACAAALAAWEWSKGKAVWLKPAAPPFHPFDFAC